LTHSSPTTHRFLVAALAVPLCIAGCTSWRQVADHGGWVLYHAAGEEVSVAEYEAAFEPAFEAVEEWLGPFSRPVRVHAWHGSVRVTESGHERVQGDEDSGVQEVPGIGLARIQAYHARGGGFDRTGIFIGVADPGTAVHELVHARFAELDADIPLWFEEGVASLLGDGALFEGRWVVDGLAFWPLGELREAELTDEDLERLLVLEAADEFSVRDNVLVHFLGWAVIFDLYRETKGLDWERWLADFEAQDPLPEVRRRLDRTLGSMTEKLWLKRLADPDPAVRLAAVKGAWKLRTRTTLDTLLEAAAREQHPEVRTALAVNALATAGELRLSWRSWRRVERTLDRAFTPEVLTDPRERAALEVLRETYRDGSRRKEAREALDQLARYWEE
jgi:hypothetical protein